MSSSVRIPLLAALLLLLGAALAVSLVPAGLALDRRVEAELRRSAVDDLGRAPMILEDRNAAREEALSMHAMSVAQTEGLAEAVGEGRMEEAERLARATAGMYGEEPVLVGPDGRSFVGPTVDSAALAAVRTAGSAVFYVYQEGLPRAVALATLGSGEGWRGAAGSSSALDASLATALSALARADVTILGADGVVVASTLPEGEAESLAGALSSSRVREVNEKVVEVPVGSVETWVARADVTGAGSVLFSRVVLHELAAVPAVRRSALLAGILTLVLALAVGSAVAVALTRPVRGLARAASQVAAGDFDAPVPASHLEEVDRLGRAFRTMRESLRARLAELAEANRALEDRQRRLRDLQSELIRQDRLASSARMAAELAHEIRNPVANVRNCIEVVRRGLDEASEGAKFADMAIDELLRMHELAEHLLDLNRPAEPEEGSCTPGSVAAQVATLASVGEHPVPVEVDDGSDGARAALPPDALKQILFNLLDNAREAAGSDRRATLRVRAGESTVTIDVLDEGPGIPPEVLSRVFDPFFTTKGAVTGVGLGLFVAEGLARRYGGRMEAANREDRTGARFRLEVPRAGADGEEA